VDLIPQLIDPAQDDNGGCAELMDRILCEMVRQGVWLHPEGRWAVTLAGSSLAESRQQIGYPMTS
jgi:hypothetical protein